MKKLFLMAAVVLGMSMVSCGGNAEKAAEEAPVAEEQVEEVVANPEEVAGEVEEAAENAEGQVEGAAEEVVETPAN